MLDRIRESETRIVLKYCSGDSEWHISPKRVDWRGFDDVNGKGNFCLKA